jgi:hypothetical protein
VGKGDSLGEMGNNISFLVRVSNTNKAAWESASTMTNSVAWMAFAVSVISALIAGSAFWVNRETLRLDVYTKRFDIYTRTVDFWHLFSEWIPSTIEHKNISLENSPKLKEALASFTKASREAQFLFDDESGIHKLLEQMHTDAIKVIGYKRDMAPHLIGKPEMKDFYDANLVIQQWIDAAIPLLEEKLAPYLDFHSLSVLD